MIKKSVENLNQTYGFPLPGTKSRIYVKFSRPQSYEGALSVLVSGWITDENKQKHKFSGALVKSIGVNFKDVSKDLTNSLEEANEKAGKPIADPYDFVNSKLVGAVPYDAMDDFFKGIKTRKTKPKTETKTDKTKGKPKVYTKLPKNQPVVIDVDAISSEDKALYDSLITTYDGLISKPIGIIFDDAGEKASVIFPNKSYAVIPRKYLDPYSPEKSRLEKQLEKAYQYYMENRDNNPERFDLGLVEAIVDYKKNHSIPLDATDEKLLQEKRRAENSKSKSKTDWIKNIFRKKKV